MRRNAVVSLLAIIIALCVLSACKGRTADNMVPLGETVEVHIDTIAEAPADTLLQSETANQPQ